MKVCCACTHSKSRHRQMYGEPNIGECRDCPCKRLQPMAACFECGNLVGQAHCLDASTELIQRRRGEA